MKERAVYLIIILITSLVMCGFLGGKCRETFTGINSDLVGKYNSSWFTAGCSMSETDDKLKQECCEKGFCDENTTMFKEGNALDDNQKKAKKLCPALAKAIDGNLGMTSPETVNQICAEMKTSQDCRDCCKFCPRATEAVHFCVPGRRGAHAWWL